MLISVIGLRTEGGGPKDQEARSRKQEVTRGNKGEAT
jgi:hypothetical protein